MYDKVKCIALHTGSLRFIQFLSPLNCEKILKIIMLDVARV